MPQINTSEQRALRPMGRDWFRREGVCL